MGEDGGAERYYAVAVPDGPLDQTRASAIAVALELTVMEVRSGLAIPGVPRPFVTRADRELADSAVAALRAAGVAAAVVTDAELAACGAGRVEVRDVRVDGEDVVVTGTDGVEVVLAGADVVMFVSGARERTFEGAEIKQSGREFNAVAFGAGMGRGVRKTGTRTNTKSEVDQFLTVYRSSLEPPITLLSNRVRYDWLGEERQATARANFARTTATVMAVAPDAPTHTGLSKARPIPGTQSIGEDPLVIADLAFLTRDVARPHPLEAASIPDLPAPKMGRRAHPVAAPKCVQCGDEISRRHPYYELNGSPWCVVCGERELPRPSEVVSHRVTWLLMILAVGAVVGVLTYAAYVSFPPLQYGVSGLGGGVMLWMLLRDSGPRVDAVRVIDGERVPVFARSLLGALVRKLGRKH
jgi:hypothetical protein